MAKKVMFVGEFPSQGERDVLAALCSVTPSKFVDLFEHGTIFSKTVPWYAKDAVLRANALLAETTYPILVLIGPRVAEAFGVAEQPLLHPFPLGIEVDVAPNEIAPAEQVRLIVKIPASSKDKFYKRKNMRLFAKTLMQSFVAMSQMPVTQEEAIRCCQIVRQALGDDMDLITKMHVEAVEKDVAAGKTVDNFDIGKLMVEYARNVKLWVKPND